MKSNKLLQKSAEDNNLSHILKQASDPIRKKKGRFQKPTEKPKTRKELRKSLRKNKKAEKHKYLLAKAGKTVEEPGKKKPKKKKKKNRKRNRRPVNKDAEDGEETEGKEVSINSEPGKYVKIRPVDDNPSKTTIQRLEDDKEMEELKKEMEETRKRRLEDENAEEDKFIKQMEKRLKLNKKAKIPASFKTDGLDYLLELCQSVKKKKSSLETEEDSRPSSKLKKKEEESLGDDDLEEDDSDSENFASENELDSGEENSLDEGGDSEEDDLKSAEEEEDETSSVDHNQEEIDSIASNEEEEVNNSDDESDVDLPPAKQKDDLKSKKKKIKKEDDLWEDIYGRMRRKDGSIVDDKLASNTASNTKPATAPKTPEITPGKYVPPMQRKNQTPRDKINRSLKGLLNRLSEANMHTISRGIEELYMANSRNEMNECLLELLYAVLLRNVSMPERVILEHVMLIAILHANIGSEIGAFFIQKFVENFREKYDSKSTAEDSKELENLLILTSSMYHFKVVDACLLYDLLKLLANNFQPKDVELILAVLKNVGFRLRKDDPVELKALIILIQQKATAEKSSASGAKIKFMLEVVTAIRNNNMSKIPNYDPSVGDHLQKILKSHIHKGNYVSTIKIKMKDLLNAETKGRWWIVGSAWTNVDSDKKSNLETSDVTTIPTKDKLQNEKLLEKARALGMNTETRKTIFCILMTAEDYVDAYTKLNQLDLKNNQERELIHVTTYCCLHEKRFNPYYALISSKLCTLDRKHMLTLQYNLWDRLKDLNSLKSYQLINLAKFLVHLINDKSLPLASLKVIEYAEMDKVKLKFLKEVLCGILLQDDEDNIQEIFFKTASSENLTLFRESLRLFMGHFLLQKNVITSDGEDVGCDIDQMDTLKDRIKIAENAMSLGRSRVQL